ncbi:hypothetical protein BGX26_011658, partial [Mortierella sp. AD094]
MFETCYHDRVVLIGDVDGKSVDVHVQFQLDANKIMKSIFNKNLLQKPQTRYEFCKRKSSVGPVKV